MDIDALRALSAGYIKASGARAYSVQAVPIPATDGGTGIGGGYAVGDLLYASAAGTLAKLPDVATGNVLLSGGVTTAPAYGKVALASAVSGTLPVANGGTATTTAGTGSGYDADLLDGQHGSYYQSATNLNAGTIPDARFSDWTTWDVTWTGITLVNGIEIGHYCKVGDTIFWNLYYKRGSSDTLAGAVTFSLPVTAYDYTALGTPADDNWLVGMSEVKIIDNNVSSTAAWDGTIKYGTTTAEFVELANNASGNDDTNAWSGTAPITWATNDRIYAAGWYRAA